MSRLHLVDPAQAEGEQKELLDGIQKKVGKVPNLYRVFANSPEVLKGYLALNDALGKTSLNPQVREQIALAVGEANNCDYCLAAHSAIGEMTGLTRDQILDARQAASSDPGIDAILSFPDQCDAGQTRVANSLVRRIPAIIVYAGHAGEDWWNLPVPRTADSH